MAGTVMEPINWTLDAYSLSTWTDLIPSVSKPTIVKSVSVSTGANSAHVLMRIADSSGTSRAVIISGSNLEANTGYGLADVVLTLGVGDALQVQGDVSGLNFAAFGAQ